VKNVNSSSCLGRTTPLCQKREELQLRTAAAIVQNVIKLLCQTSAAAALNLIKLSVKRQQKLIIISSNIVGYKKH
jgi:hypothetical protein